MPLLVHEFAAALQRSSRALLSQQAPEGFWCGELTADATLESDYILLQLFLHQPEDHAWNPPTAVRIQKAARAILERQLSDGGFNIYSGGPADVRATVKAYCALKLAGIDPDGAQHWGQEQEVRPDPELRPQQPLPHPGADDQAEGGRAADDKASRPLFRLQQCWEHDPQLRGPAPRRRMRHRFPIQQSLAERPT